MAEGREQPYDPYIPPGGQGGGNAGGNQRTAALQAQIDDTVGVMRENINKVSQRGENLNNLQNKTDNLATSAQGFNRGANKVRKKMMWENAKMRLWIILAIFLCVIIIVVIVVVVTKH